MVTLPEKDVEDEVIHGGQYESRYDGCHGNARRPYPGRHRPDHEMVTLADIDGDDEGCHGKARIL